MKDLHGRPINYMRLSVTDRCNLRCFYCTPSRTFRSLPPEEILSYEEFLRLARLALGIGIVKFRVTGGEPLVRKGLAGFIRSLTGLKGATDVSLTTNGVLLEEHLDELWDAGLRRINVSLDTLDAEAYTEITGGGRLAAVLEGIDGALEKGFSPVKLNVVLLKGMNDYLSPFVALARDKPLHIRFIELMDFSPAEGYFVSCRETKARLAAFGSLEEVTPPEGAGPARYFQLPGSRGSFGFICPYSEHFCASCNRLRVSADGRLLPCLFSESFVDLKSLMRSGIDDEALLEVLKNTLEKKPHDWMEATSHSRGNGLRTIGG